MKRCKKAPAVGLIGELRRQDVAPDGLDIYLEKPLRKAYWPGDNAMGIAPSVDPLSLSGRSARRSATGITGTQFLFGFFTAVFHRIPCAGGRVIDLFTQLLGRAIIGITGSQTQRHKAAQGNNGKSAS